MLVALVSLSVLVGTTAGLGVSGGITAARILLGRGPVWTVLGAAGVGLVIGTTVKLLGMDAFSLLFGAAPAGVTGGLEGAAIGLALGLGTVAMGGFTGSPRWKPVLGAGVASGVAGIIIASLGGRLMAGSLQLLTTSFAGSRLKIELLGRFFGEASFGPRTQVILGGLEGFIFGCCVVGGVCVGRGRGSGSSQTVTAVKRMNCVDIPLCARKCNRYGRTETFLFCHRCIDPGYKLLQLFGPDGLTQFFPICRPHALHRAKLLDEFPGRALPDSGDLRELRSQLFLALCTLEPDGEAMRFVTCPLKELE